MEAYVDVQEKEFDLQSQGYTAVKHQREVGVGYFDMVMETIGSSLTALKESTEAAQF
jgi:isocitrate lyase